MAIFSLFTPASIDLEPPHTLHVEISNAQAKEIAPLYVLDEVDFATTTPEEPYDVRCFCVTFIREKYGVNIKGDANTIKPNSSPREGGVVLTRYNGISHVSYIEKFTQEGYLVTESNFKECQITSRVIPYNYPFIVGFYHDQPIYYDTSMTSISLLEDDEQDG